jgi:C2 domain
LSDPLANFYHFGTTINTKIFPNTLNPAWNQRLFFQSWTVNDELPPMIVTVFDHDKKMIGDDEYEFLGSTVVNFKPENNVTDPRLVPEPKWYSIAQDKNSSVGKILLSFTVLDPSVPIGQEIP